MRYLFGFLCVCALLGVLPQSVVAQAGEEAVPKLAVAIHSQHRLPPQLMLRASYFLYLDADEKGRSRVERWHPEAFVDPSKPASEPSLKLEVDSTALEMTPTAPPTLEELERREKKRRGRAIGIGVGVVVGLAVVGLAIGAGIAVSNFEI